MKEHMLLQPSQLDPLVRVDEFWHKEDSTKKRYHPIYVYDGYFKVNYVVPFRKPKGSKMLPFTNLGEEPNPEARLVKLVKQSAALLHEKCRPSRGKKKESETGGGAGGNQVSP